MANIIVTSTVNKVTWDVDKTSFGRALKAVKQIRSEWEKTGKAFSSAKADPAAALKRSAMQARMVNKRLNQTERAEAAKTTAHNIAMAKKEARAREAIDKIEKARRKAAVSRLTAGRSPESQANYNALKAQLRQQEKLAAKNGAYGTNPSISAARMAAYEASLKNKGAGSGGSPILNANAKAYDPKVVEQQRKAMERDHARIRREQVKQDKADNKAREKMARDAEREAGRRARAREAKISTISNANVRLRAKYGDKYARKLPGYDSLVNRYMKSGNMKASNFRAELASMETGLRKANANTLSLNDGLRNLRSTLISVTAAYGAFNAAASVLKTGQFFQGMEATMLMVSDDSAEAGKRIEFVRNQAYRLGLDLKVAAQGYTQMSIAANGVLTKSQNDQLFKSFSEYATALQVDPVKYQRGITAIQQMMGKGQIMSEELKQQLAEGIPGSLQVFVKASQEAFNDSTIDVEKLMDMMKKGELKAAKVLPFVAKYYAEAANKGGALQKALQGNRVAMQRLGQTWMNFQNKIFESGFGDKMTETFNNLAKILDSNGPLAAAVGQFVAGFIDGFMKIPYALYNAFTMVNAILERYIPIFRKNGEDISKTWNWVGWGIGALFFATSLVRVFNILAKIAGLAGAIKGIGAVFGKGEGAPPSGGEGGGGSGPARGGRFSRIGKFFKGAGSLGGLLSLFTLGSELNDRYNPYSDFNEERGKVFSNVHDSIVSGKTGSWFSNLWGPDKATLDYLNNQMPGTNGKSSATPPMVIPTEPVSGQITIKLDAGELKDMINQEIEASNMGNINLILGVPD